MEQDLKKAFRRQEPPEGFAGRVLAQVPTRPRVQPPSFRWSWLAAAAATTITAVGVGTYEYQREKVHRLEGQRAKTELMFALQVTSEKLQSTRTKISRDF